MHDEVAYDDWAPIYDVWTDTAPVTKLNLPFYVERLLAADGPAVELGVGNGRIAVEAAIQGARVIGVDSSSVMLSICRQRARDEGVDGRLTLIKADFRDFELPEPADLVVIPFHSIGHMLTPDDRRTCFARAFDQLKPGGRLVFDHFVFDEPRARQMDGLTRLRGEYVDPETARDTLLWVNVRFDFRAERMHILAISEEVDPFGTTGARRIRRMDFSWMAPDQAQALLGEAGFEIEHVWGGFDETPFTAESSEQIYTARKPA